MEKSSENDRIIKKLCLKDYLFARYGEIMKKESIVYTLKPTLTLSEDELRECCKLYNENYGVYRMDSEYNPGKSVKFPMSKYKQYQQDGFFVATARYKGELIAHAFYIRKRYNPYGIMTWVLQLVVNKNFRKKGIASTLLHSIWGFSNDYAWGLATANPCTVKTLESATCRACDPEVISDNDAAVKLIGNDTTFITDKDYYIDDKQSVVNTRFFVDNSKYDDMEKIEDKLGKLLSGYEWIAITFQSQKINPDIFKRNMAKWFEMYESKLKQAYSRMNMTDQGWAQKTSMEVDFICSLIKGKSIFDMGCGQGRHAIELARRGYNVTGIDFSESNIEAAKRIAYKENILNVNFLSDDVRGIRFGNKYDNIICLYDVVGSFADEKDNNKILKRAYENLNKGGLFILSVMNMELTNTVCHPHNFVSVEDNPEALIGLKASSTMQTSGEVFNPDFFIIDKDTGLVYRKEQFDNNNELSAEYLIRDKRYTMNEITSLVESIGFTIEQKMYTSAGFSQSLTFDDIHAKEILIVAKK